MANPNLGSLMAAAMDEAMRTSPDPFRDSYLFYAMSGKRRPSYRAELDEMEVNYLGNVIPRIERVKRNIRLLRDPRLPPSRLR